jgi:hypothetical protein
MQPYFLHPIRTSLLHVYLIPLLLVMLTANHAAAITSVLNPSTYNSSNHSFWGPPSLVIRANLSIAKISIRPPTQASLQGELLLSSYDNGGGINGFIRLYPLSTLSAADASPLLAAGSRSDVLFGGRSRTCSEVPWDASMPSPVSYDAHPTAAVFLRSSTGGASDIVYADSPPHTNIIRLSRAQGHDGSKQVTLSRVAGLATNCNFNVSAPLNASMASQSLMGWSFGLIEDPSDDGVVYISQPNAIARVDRAGQWSYYFGDPERPGMRNESYNYNTTRWNATTLWPSQIAVDAPNRMMYVAESGMATIRAIDMSASGGSAVVVAGKLEWLGFPPDSCKDDNCTAADLHFIYPDSVAVYHSEALQETWLFVGDFTASVVYRIVLETGKATVVAGSMLDRYSTKKVPLGHQGNLATYFDPALSIGSLFMVVHGGVLRIQWKEPPVAPEPSSPEATTTETVAGGITTSSVAVGILFGGVAVTEATAIITVSSVRCRVSSSRRRGVIQNMFFFFLSNDNNNAAPSSLGAWVMLALVLAFAAGHMLTVSVVHRAALRNREKLDDVDAMGSSTWLLAAVKARFPSVSWIAADTLCPLAVYAAMEAASSPQQTSNEVASASMVVIFIMTAFVATRVYFQRMVAPGIDFKERIVNPLCQYGGPLPLQSQKDDENVMPPRQDSRMTMASSSSFISLTSSFASLLGVAPQRRGENVSAQTQALQASFTAFSQQDIIPPVVEDPFKGSKNEAQSTSLLLACLSLGTTSVMPRGYWMPPDVTRRWNTAFSKMDELYRDQKWMETSLTLISGLLSGIASGMSDQPACQPLMGLLAAMFFLAACAVVWWRPYRLPTESFFTPTSFVLLALICLVNALDDEMPQETSSVLQILHSIVVVTKTIAQLLITKQDQTVYEEHIKGRGSVIELNRVGTDEAFDTDALIVASPTTDNSSIGWSRQQTSTLINDSFLVDLKPTGKAMTVSRSSASLHPDQQLSVDPSSLAQGRGKDDEVSSSAPDALLAVKTPATKAQEPAVKSPTRQHQPVPLPHAVRVVRREHSSEEGSDERVRSPVSDESSDLEL